MNCTQCNMAMINGVACHETGCPYSGSRWNTELECWIPQRKCFECGCYIDADDLCCSAPLDYDEDADIEDSEDEDLDEAEL